MGRKRKTLNEYCAQYPERRLKSPWQDEAGPSALPPGNHPATGTLAHKLVERMTVGAPWAGEQDSCCPLLVKAKKQVEAGEEDVNSGTQLGRNGLRLTMQPPKSYSVGGQRSSRAATGKPAVTRPDYRGRWCAIMDQWSLIQILIVKHHLMIQLQ
ncbi:UNVERIFIED_CONTAM: hypothetical protein FKN15_031047 [Acipenser sinensis]